MTLSRTTRIALAAGVAMTAFAMSRPMAQAPAPPVVPGFEQLRKVDVHAHVYEDLPGLASMLHRINLRIVNVSVPGTDGHLAFMHDFNAAIVKRHPDAFSWASTFDPTPRTAPDHIARTTAALDETFAKGAVMVKIWKEVGLEVRKADGTYMLPDDPSLDPIYRHIAARKKPLLAHLAEPKEAWEPLEPGGLHSGYYRNNPQWHLLGKPDVPSHQAIIDARDRVLAKHPDLVVIGAHIGSLEHDVDEAAKRLDRYPNFHVEVAARTRDLTRQPTEKVRAFFMKYQDRILYGTDRSWRAYRTPAVTPTDAQREAFVTGLEAQYRLDYAFYAGTEAMTYAGATVQPLALPREVLEKLYWRNAERLLGVR